MSNFQFLQAEFKSLFEHAQAVEPLVNTDARAACARARHALEVTVNWLYEYDRSLHRPYDRNLNALLTQPDFKDLLGEAIWEKTRVIQRDGNFAVHGSRPIKTYQAQQLCKELFHILYWVARNYSQNNSRGEQLQDLQFDPKKLPLLVSVKDAANFTKQQLAEQEDKFQQEMARLKAEQEKRDEKIEAELASRLDAATDQQRNLLDEREKALEAVNAELAAVRAKLANAKAVNQAEPDTHDYNEFDTRKYLIDVQLREAGWTIGEDAGEEVEVAGMPNEKGVGFVDYVLWGKDGKPLAVVEAKRTLKDPGVGQQQAKLYADCLENMKGQRPLIFYTNGYSTWLWDDRRAPPRKVQGFYTLDELELAIQRRNMTIDPATLSLNKDIAGRYYQHRAIQSICETFSRGQRAALLTMATGTGKTRTAVALVEILQRANLVKRVLFLADRKALVKQAANAFKAHLPDSSPVNLVTDKNTQGRVYVSTYPTMMGLIDKKQDGQSRFGIGHFDLVIVDEAHRSVYQKYKAIFEYFDSYLVGLTATPRDEVHRDTYALFGLERGVPTDAYSLDQAIKDGFLVPPKAMDVPLKFIRQGIKYDELSDEEKEHWDSIDWGEDHEGHAPDEVHASQINKQLFNQDTVDKMLAHLMENGIKVQAGERLGKTIIFAVNQRHATFIAERFDVNYPHLKGLFARIITHSVNYAQSLIDDFSISAKDPVIAVSVDMLDTGIDVPEVLNLVFFKAVRSKVKFLQMIGRGTRLCEDLFGPGRDKGEFLIFDYCGNFEFFNENPEGRDAAAPEPLGKRLFKTRAELLARLQGDEEVRYVPPRYETSDELTGTLANILRTEVAGMNLDNFLVRPHGEHVEHYTKPESWHRIDEEDLGRLANHVAGLPSELPEDHITAKLFDLTCLHLQVALLDKSTQFARLQQRIQEIASKLEQKVNVPVVKAQLALIMAVQGEEYWEGITLGIIEQLRLKLRALVQFIDKHEIPIVYTVLEDELGEITEVGTGIGDIGINWVQYRKKVEAFIRGHKDHITIAKLHRNKALTPQDLVELERFIFEQGGLGSKGQFSEAYGAEASLTVFIRKLIGLDRNAAVEAFSEFLGGKQYTEQQIRFIERIIDHLTHNGVIDPGMLYEPPFTSAHQEGVDGVFANADVDRLFAVIEGVNENAAVQNTA
ncbi:MAG: DEAD/DEAH box helicase family protein [Zhongshania sp.]|jgi:type I restriction enzyme R subunit|nr:DEAD/DEAH box helicase family protein [Zhongshania sp.]